MTIINHHTFILNVLLCFHYLLPLQQLLINGRKLISFYSSLSSSISSIAENLASIAAWRCLSVMPSKRFSVNIAGEYLKRSSPLLKHNPFPLRQENSQTFSVSVLMKLNPPKSSTHLALNIIFFAFIFVLDLIKWVNKGCYSWTESST